MFYSTSVLLLVFAFLHCFASKADEVNYKHAFSAQVGINGASGYGSSFGFQALPPDLSYAYKLFDDNKYVLSTSFFYDNIGVKAGGLDFNYRIGQRLDVGYQISKTAIYTTLGLAKMMMKGNLANSTSLVYGFGMEREVSKRWSVMSELNFQDVKSYKIVNLSAGFIYAFNL
jgi:hypothetical protein